MRSGVALVAAWTLRAIACGGSTPSPSAPTPATSASAAKAPSTDPNRHLSKSECESLGEVLAEACQNRPNERSERVIGWCAELLRGVQDGSWVAGDCRKHIRYMDSECLRAAGNVHAIMDCDRSIERAD